ncbi:hypothetical protein [Actinomyces marmotae]|uniref:Uncharacterized protein n=1 Tax=Actinomyces marmotae TaxID=2737173 RepID=A0A6M8B4D1_9ACTO|nr:hypothetical protein [Actinomyces marmotae]QKD78906.1 hypothetical protein HPC72_00260 [Actinomyces marmotae]
MSRRRRNPQQRFARAVVYGIILLTVLGMILAMISASSAASTQDTAGRAPVIVLGTRDLTWGGLREIAGSSSSAAGDAGSLLDAASSGEPVNVVVRSANPATCPADGWLTLGAGSRARALPPGAASTPGAPACLDAPDAASALAASRGSGYEARPGALATALAKAGAPATAIGDAASLALATEGGAATTSDSLKELLASGPSGLTLVDTAAGVTTAEQRVTALARAREAVLAAMPRARVVIVSVADAESPGPQIGILPAGTTSPRGRDGGLLVGDSTHQAGLIQLTDLAPTILAALTGSPHPGGASARMTGSALALPDSPPPAASAEPGATDPAGSRAVEELADGALRARASHLTTIPSILLLVAASGALALTAALALRGAPRPRALIALRGASLAASCLPLAALLSGVIPWWRAGASADEPSWAAAAAALAAILFIGGALAGLVALATRAVGRPRGEVALVAGLTSLAWLLDAALGAPLAFNGALGMDAVVAGRFYGMSNTGFAIAAAALIIAIAALRALSPPGRGWALGLVALMGGGALALDGAPWLGADLGGALTLAPVLVVLAVALAAPELGRRGRLRAGLGAVAGMLVVGTVLAGLDLARPADRRTHLGRFAAGLADGSAWGTLERKAGALIAPFLSSALALTALMAGLVTVVGAAWWGAREHRAWREGRSAYRWLTTGRAAPRWVGSALVGLGVLVVVETLLNDSGPSMAVISAATAAPLILRALLAARPGQRPA